MICKFAHIVDGFGHGANISGCNMNIDIHVSHKEFTFAHGILLQMTLHSILIEATMCLRL